MNIWTRLGSSVALAAIFCIGAAELLQPTLLYQQHKWSVCAAFLITGVALFGIGRWLNQKRKTRYLDTQSQLLAQDRDNDPRHWEPFLLINVAYWGAMMVIFGCIVVFIVPSYDKRDKGKVTVRAAEATPRKAATAQPERAKPEVAVRTDTKLEVPRFKLQGIVLREGNSSALIDGRTYLIGEVVRDGRIVSIESNSVALEWRGIKVVLPAPK
jgi:hypothetical protein